MSTAENEKVYSTIGLIKTLAHFIRPYKWKFVLASVCRIISDLSWLYPAYALATIITFFSEYQAGQSLRTLWLVMTLWTLSSLGRFIGMYFARSLGYQVGEKIKLDAQLATIKHLFLLDIAWHEKENAGNKLKKIDRGANGLHKVINLWISNFIEIGINLIGITFIIGTFDRAIAAIISVFLVTYFIISYLYRKKAVRASQITNLAEEEMHGLLFESINNIRSVKVMSMITPLYQILSASAIDLFTKIKTRIFWFQSGNTIKAIWGQAFRLGLVVFICLGIIDGRYEVGFLILCYTYFDNLWQSVTELADTTQDFAIAKYGVGRMTDILETPIQIDEEKDKVPFPSDWKKMSISGLSFSYGDKKVINKISFDITRGEKIGIIGLSGAGKSTIFKLLLKEHEEYLGEVSFDGVPLKQISKTNYFNHVAVVLQETEAFNFSLRDNITISNHTEVGNQKLLKKALTVSHVAEFAKHLPSGLNTKIGEKGVRLSGGEKQRVGIARAVFKDPQILFLDEATSHLDIESEEKIRDSLHQFFQTVTAIVIAHRLTTIKEMDRILVLEDGKIIESGSFDELYAKGGRFYELWEKQKL